MKVSVAELPGFVPTSTAPFRTTPEDVTESLELGPVRVPKAEMSIVCVPEPVKSAACVVAALTVSVSVVTVDEPMVMPLPRIVVALVAEPSVTEAVELPDTVKEPAPKLMLGFVVESAATSP